MEQITTISFFRFTSFKTKLWAFGMMQFAHKPMKQVAGLELYKLLGTGKAAFNPMPDWSVYAILQIWENEEVANRFFLSHRLFKKYEKKSNQHWVLFLKNRMTRGVWGGVNPFQQSKTIDKGIPLVVALTRATIKIRKLRTFWKYVPHSQTDLMSNQGLIYTKGVGEVPFKQMATFSLWKDEESLNTFAYRTKGHLGAIGKTREVNWYKEELFARFQPFRSIGNWGIKPLNLDVITAGKMKKMQRKLPEPNRGAN